MPNKVNLPEVTKLVSAKVKTQTKSSLKSHRSQA